MKKIKLLFVLIISFAINTFSQHFSEIGSPFIQNFKPEQYNANNQNWAIVQDNRGIMYFGNTNGILEFDNNTWKTILSSTSSTIRTLELAPDGLIYGAGNGDLGYLAIKKDGKMSFISLVDKLPEKERKFNQIRKLNTTSYGTYFYTKDKIFLYHADTFQILNFPTLALFGFTIDDMILVLSKDNAIYSIQGNKITKLPGTDNITIDAGRTNITKFNKNKILILTENKGFYTYDISLYFDKNKKTYNFENENITPVLKKFEINFTDYFKENNLYCTYTLKDGNIAIGTIYGGLIIMDTLGNPVEIIKKSNGLYDNAISSIYQDNSNNIWVTHLKGISYIHYNSKIFYFSESEGLEGSVYKTYVFNGTIYVGTANGLFYLPQNNINEKNVNSFKYVEETKERVWDISSIQDFLIISTSKYIGIIKNNKVIERHALSDVYSLYYNENFPDKLFFGTTESFGYIYIKKQNNKLSFGEKFIFPDIKTAIRNITYFEGSFWLGSSFDGVYQIEIQDLEQKLFKIIHYDKSRGLYKLENVYPLIYDNKLYIGCSDTVRKPDGYKLVPANLFNSNTNDTIGYSFIKRIEDKIYIVTSNSAFGYLFFDKSKKEYTLKRDAGAKIKGFQIYEMFLDTNKNILLSTNKGLVKLNTQYPTDYTLSFNTLVRKIIIGKDSIIFDGNFVDINSFKDSIYTKVNSNYTEEPLKIKYKQNSMKIFYSSTQYEVPEGTKYSYWLEGFEETWSEWTELNNKEYSYLREGKYTFHVKAKNLYDVESQETTFSFIILAPWYRTIYAYIGYLIFLAVFVYLIVYLNSLRLKAENKRLEKIIDERTSEIRQKNVILTQQKEEIQAQAETLASMNVELEKLAIVARETDNSIIIMDSIGTLQWANHGFEKLYGITFQTLIEKFGNNLIKVSTNEKIKETLDTCLEEKKTVVYESEFKKNEKRVWLQSTLTPILDPSGKIIKLIAVETDISKIKEYELEILSKNEEINAQKEELESINSILNEQNEFIKAGIRYAKSIQRAILPNPNSFPKFVDTFILFLPKDIVSGDFYWYSEVHEKDKDYFYFAAVDCTGHGVPGAFMSLIANRMLTEIVNVEHSFDTNIILDKLKEKVLKALQQKETGNQDGMDLVLARIQKLENKFEVCFSGAKRPLIVFNSDKKEVEVYKADRISIGGYDSAQFNNFTSIKIELKTNDILYLSSDGYVDQNNANRKRLGTNSLTTIINEINDLPMNEQQAVFHKVLTEWMGGEIQRDDITLIGIKLI